MKSAGLDLRLKEEMIKRIMSERPKKEHHHSKRLFAEVKINLENEGIQSLRGK